MRTIEIFLIVVTVVVCIGVGFYISWVNKGYERRRLEDAERKKPSKLPVDTPPA